MRTSLLGQCCNYVRFRGKCKKRGGYGIHSPFLYSLYVEVIEPSRHEPIFEKAEKYRKEMINCGLSVFIRHLGETIQNGYSGQEIKLAYVARHVAVPMHLGRLLYRLVSHVKPATVLELGTSVGISSIYMALADSNAQIHTIEGNETILDLASNRFRQLGLNNIKTYSGEFDVTLPKLLSKLQTIDFVFIDGDHKGDSLLRYIQLIQPKLTKDSVVVIDDIRWSRDMERAWNKIRSSNDVTLSLDLFRCGVLFFREGIVKQHFYLRYGPF
ncbi:MAG: class I SAM-dependent methyltransferase [Bacteroidales bacterium]|nr:class I SAM-dependent methyltransferase [Bacteroidales bacterium]HPD95256.1 class I SAM-dependent methyltransferase [Tenuifilaceae bacterium]HRX31453.1 class I SAM-dependent methyltransferase [Tenuifilaceae bacterium]